MSQMPRSRKDQSPRRRSKFFASHDLERQGRSFASRQHVTKAPKELIGTPPSRARKRKIDMTTPVKPTAKTEHSSKHVFRLNLKVTSNMELDACTDTLAVGR